MLKGLRSFMSWTHPQVTVSEVESPSDSPSYEVCGYAGFSHLRHGCCMFFAFMGHKVISQARQHISASDL